MLILPSSGGEKNYTIPSSSIWIAFTPVVFVCLLDVPKFPKEIIDPVVVEEGQPFTLKCDPPKGIPPLQIYWMTISE